MVVAVDRTVIVVLSFDTVMDPCRYFAAQSNSAVVDVHFDSMLTEDLNSY